MRRKRLLRQVYPLFLAIAVAALLMHGGLLSALTPGAGRNAAVLTLAALTAAMCAWVVRQATRPLAAMTRGAERFAAGNLSDRVPVSELGEIGALAEAMNQMAMRLDDRLRTAMRQRNEQEAVLAGMVEGVLAFDGEGRLININQSAANLLGVDPVEARGRSIQEVIQNIDLQRIVSRALASDVPVEGEIVLRDQGERYMQAHGTNLRDENEAGIGALIVLNDVTRLRRLETIRREFVANVSHELKTPITSIKGFIETLLDGAINDPAESRRFLGIVARQSDRLHAIVEDLLSLSRIEQEAEKREIPLDTGEIGPVLRAAIEACAIKASEKTVTIRVECGEALLARINGPLLEQAVINLIDNAIKYSEGGGEVAVAAARSGGHVVISVRDGGCGIPREHLPRLFERFYRVDKARSRKLGGTGLGLAIVKHISQAHHGQVTVESAPGRGSVFSIRLPAA